MNVRIFVLPVLAAAVAACTSTPERNVALDQAQRDFQTAQRDAQVSTLAGDELKRAKDYLQQAQMAWENREEKPVVDHLAYMAGQQVTIAEATASSLASQKITASAAAERDQLLLQVRTDEANAAERRLGEAEQRNIQSGARVSELESQLKALNAKQTERGLVVTLGDVLFESGQAEILPGAAGNMGKLADFFQQYPERRATIEGYTDSTGSAEANYILSRHRADAVKAALVSLGVSADRLSTRAFGEERPVGDNNTTTGRQLNRRVEIVFAPQSDEFSSRQNR